MTVLVTFLSAVAAGLGLGSGGLYLLYLLEGLGMPQYTAQGMNLLFFSLSALASTLLNAAAGRLSAARLLPLLLFGGIGTLCGTLLTAVVPPDAARRAFGILSVLGGAWMLLRSLPKGANSAKRKKKIP